MKVYESQEEVEKDIHNGVLRVDDDVRFHCDISIDADIIAQDITASWYINARDITALDITAGNINVRDIDAGDIKAQDITARGITAWDITAQDITTGNIDARDITAWDITAQDITAGNITARDITASWDINAWNITAGNITAQDISYYAICGAYENIRCRSIEGSRGNALHFCLDGDIIIGADKPEKMIDLPNDKSVSRREEAE